MDFLGDNRAENQPVHQNQNVDFDHADTQLFESQCCSPLSFSEHWTETQVLSLTGETQVLDVGLSLTGETQVLDVGLSLAGETQVLDVGGETQVLDDLDFVKNIGTQVLGEFDDERASDGDGCNTDGTEVLFDTDDLSDDEPLREGCKLVAEADVQHTSPCSQGNSKGSSDRCASLAGERKSSEVAPRFTSVRVSSMHASGLAVHGLTLKGTNSESSSLLIDGQCYDQCTIVGNNDSNQICDLKTDEGNLKGLDNEEDDRTRCPTARTLFYEDVSAGHEGVSHETENFDERECLAGLSYVDSQEPGDLSQANALNFVERFINDNMVECDTEIDHGKSTGRKSNSLSIAKWPQSLAKKNAKGDTVEKTGIFYWDDHHEDDGGGDFFCRYKEDLLGKGSQARKSSIEHQQPKRKRLEEHRGMHQQSNDSDKRMVHSPSKLMLEKSEGDGKTVLEAEMKYQKYHHHDSNKQSKKESCMVQLVGTASLSNAPECPDVGLDTQMAAEAMELLSVGDGVPNDNANDVQQTVQINPSASAKASNRGKTENRCSGPVSTMEVHGGPDVLSTGQLRKAKKIARQSNQTSSIMLRSCSKDVRESDVGPQVQEMNWAGRDAKEPCYTDVQPSRESKTKGLFSGNGELENIRSSLHDDLCLKLTTRRYPKRKRSCRKLSNDVRKCDDLDALSKPSALPIDARKAVNVLKRSTSNFRSTGINFDMRKMRSACTTDFSLINRNLGGKYPHQRPENRLARVDAPCCNSEFTNGNLIFSTSVGAEAENLTEMSQVVSSPTGKSVVANTNIDNSPKETPKPSPSLCTTPVSCVISPKYVSPICTGGECFKQSSKKNLSRSSLVRALFSLSPLEQEFISPSKDMRKRRDLTKVHVLFSQHLDEDIIKQQKKIMVRLGISEVSTIADATHFITDNFVRTRNMLEAIASGKPVVTHLWLESVGQVNIHIDEEAYILRDIKKEREFGFCMPVSLARARKCPLLQGRNVLVTPNTKPSKDTILLLVKAVHGQAVEGTGRSAPKDDKILDDLLILSCEEDYAVCVPLLEKGAPVYSSELLLNGIVTQNLEYERYRLFAEHVKRTSSRYLARSPASRRIPNRKGNYRSRGAR